MLDQVQELKRALEEEKENNGENIEALSNALRIAQSDLAAIDAQREELLVVIRQLNMEIRAYKDKKDELQALTE
jgi:peptidoglycan hydrolase CwlO-like protein